MIRQPLRQNRNRVRISDVTQIPAPVKGWVANGSPMEADPLTALLMDNWFPEAQSITARAGSESFASQVAVDGVETLMAYTSGSTIKLFACGDGKIIDITAGGSFTGAAGDVSGLGEDRWYSTMFATAAGQFLVCANGGDDVRNFDGSSWTTPSITGVTSSTLVFPHAHQNRLWFIQAGTTDLWYLDTNSIAGTANKFPIGARLTKGGYPMALGSWSFDTGAGMDDMLVIYTSEGQLLAYNGTDPSVSELWTLMGVADIGKPIGRRCIHKVGGDLALLSEDGILSANMARQLDRGVIATKSITANIRDAYTAAVRRARDVYGWQMVTHPIRNMFIVNVPGSSSVPTVQFVLNTATGAWTRFTGLDARCWANYDNGIYFGRTNGRVLKADTGGTDSTRSIYYAVLPAYNHLNHRGRQKHVKDCQPIYESDIIDNWPSVSIAVDYETPTAGGVTVTPSSGYWTYDVSVYGGGDVYFDGIITAEWRGSGNIGAVVSPYTTTSIRNEGATNLFRYSLTGWTVIYEVGGVL